MELRLPFSLPRVSFSPESGGRVNPGELYGGDEDT
jgi:hypothetical protein